jgi:protein-tyrosine phosphatase
MTDHAKVLMVCTGNICRSPAMHYLAAREWAQSATVASAGTAAEVTMDATPQIRQSAAAYAVTMPRHQPRQLTAAMIADADLVLVATERHARWIAGELGGLPGHVFGLKQAAELAQRAVAPAGATGAERLRSAAAALSAEQEREPAPLRSLDDPWARDQATYDRVMAEIVDAVSALTTWADLAS